MKSTPTKKTFKRHKAGNVWNSMHITDRGNFLQRRSWNGLYAVESWYHLPEAIRRDFVEHFEISRDIYAWR